jgi:hypothetical protein
MTRAVRAALLAAGALLAACDKDPAAPPPAPIAPPTIEAAAVAPGPHNVLSAVVSATITGADSAAVRFGPAGGALDERTPARRTPDGTVAMPALGLRAATAYEFVVEAWARDTVARSARLPHVTGPLPDDLPAYIASGSARTPGHVVFAATPYAVAIDSAGRVTWYRRLDAPTLNVQPLPTGGYATHPIAADPGDDRPWRELDALGDEVRRYGCANGFRSRFHDLIAEPDGTRWLLCDEVRTMDLSAIGGDAAAEVTATVVQRLGPDGAVRLQWRALDHLAITDLDPALRAGRTVNFTHANALDLRGDGCLVLSFRSLNEVTCVDVESGAVRWRLGGRMNEFAFDTPGTPYVRQHGARAVGDGVLLLDNLGHQDGSRAELYQLDPDGRTATRAWHVGASPAATAVLGGAVQSLPDGRVLVAFGDGRRVQEFDAGGNLVWGIEGNAGYVYRATRIASLYAPGVELAR